MKKWLAMLLALAMLVSLSACGKSDEEKLAEDIVDSVLGGDDDAPASGSYKGNYVYNPPTDNYHIVYGDGTIEEARVGDKYSSIDKEDANYSFHLNYTREAVYIPYEGVWYKDTNIPFSDYAAEKDEPAYFFTEMEGGLIRYLRAFGVEEDELGEELMEYYVGDETVVGVKCWVFDSKGINTLYCKYWVDPSNGAVLKYDYYESEDAVEELTVYDVNYQTMDTDLYPPDYDAVEVL